MKILTAEMILKADDLPKEKVPVPEWGGSVYIRALTGAERDAFELSCVDENGKDDLRNVRARLVALAACGENSERLFTDDQVEALGGKSAKALLRCFNVARKLSAISPSDVKELEGNSPGTPTA